MDFISVIIFMGLYFLRPQDWFGPLMGFGIIRPLMLVAILATITRPDGFRISELLKTPVDWVMAIYFAYVILTNNAPVDMFREVLNLGCFYVVTALALNQHARLSTYLRWWMIFLIMLATLGNLQQMGIDITNGSDETEMFKGRLALGTWMHDNPNALGHSVIVAIPVIYFVMIWRRSSISKVWGCICIAWCAWCVYATQSKGSYLAGFATVVLSQAFGRPRIVQIMVLALALTFGTAALTQLPRMAELSHKEVGIQGRLIAWSFGYQDMQHYTFGKGWGKFRAEFMWEREWVTKAPHSSYVMIGATLGYPGLWLYIAVFYTGMRVLFSAKSRDYEEERNRRIIFVLLCAFMLSNWMIDRAYHTEFFLTAAVASAFHRIAYFRRSHADEEDVIAEVDADELELDFDPRLAGATGAVAGPGVKTSWGLNVRQKSGVQNYVEVIIPPGGRLDDLPDADARPLRGSLFNKLNPLDYIAITGVWFVAVKMWEYVLDNFLIMRP